MSGFVLDVSVTMAWCFEDEASAACWALLDGLLAEGAAVPSLWFLEVANVLATAERRGRTSAAHNAAFARQLMQLPIEVDGETTHHAFGATLALARERSLTAYDASYLELALRRAAPLATTDRALRRAASSLGVELLPA